MKLKIQITNRWTGSILFEYEKENNTVKDTLLEAISKGANLRSANLYGADLYGANLRGADLRSADLRSANLRSANLYGADLRSANLRSANLYGADLYGADLRSANLYGADLRSANLDPIKNDMFIVLLNAISEIAALKQAIKDGKIDGSTYSGECACLCGTIMKSSNQNIVSTIGKIKNSERPIERFFLSINPGDTPENSEFAKLAYEWIEEFESLINVPA